MASSRRGPSPRSPRWAGWSLRARLTALATALLALGLAAGSALLFGTLQRTQFATVDTGALRTGHDVATLINAGVLPEPVPASIGSAFVQVVDNEGRVHAASANTDHLIPLLNPEELAQVRDGQRLVVSGDRAGLDDPLLVVAVPAGPAADRRTVVVAASLRDVRNGLAALRTALMIGGPVLLALLGLLSWYVVGAALRPVEALRAGAEEISGTGGSRRLPVPRARDEMHRLAVTLNDMLARLDAASVRQRQFVSDAAHELRSPLASIRTQVEVARRLGEFDDSDGFADGVLADVERLSRLVDDLLFLARLDEAGRLLRRKEPVDLAALAREVADSRPNSRVPITVDGSATAWTEGDRDGLRRAIGNLVDNATRHATSSVTVHTATGDPKWTVVSVSDDGPGISEEDRVRVFDRFTRLDDARDRDSGGTGLGLPIVRDLVRAHGGTVALGDADPGLRAVVALPSATPPSTAPTAARTTVPAERRGRPAPRTAPTGLTGPTGPTGPTEPGTGAPTAGTESWRSSGRAGGPG